jgi:hypothetical protein
MGYDVFAFQWFPQIENIPDAADFGAIRHHLP